MPTRFVILHHQTAGGEHWDLMLEHGEVLLTWQLALEPVSIDSLPITATRIDDHRKAYLTYEGDISGGRGRVRRVESGRLEMVENGSERVEFTLEGTRLSGRFRLLKTDDRWEFSIEEDKPKSHTTLGQVLGDC